MTHSPADPQPLDVIARELHEHFRRCIEGFLVWEDLDERGPWHAGLIQIAYERARDLMATTGGEER